MMFFDIKKITGLVCVSPFALVIHQLSLGAAHQAPQIPIAQLIALRPNAHEKYFISNNASAVKIVYLDPKTEMRFIVFENNTYLRVKPPVMLENGKVKTAAKAEYTDRNQVPLGVCPDNPKKIFMRIVQIENLIKKL